MLKSVLEEAHRQLLLVQYDRVWILRLIGHLLPESGELGLAHNSCVSEPAPVGSHACDVGLLRHVVASYDLAVAVADGAAFVHGEALDRLLRSKTGRSTPRLLGIRSAPKLIVDVR